MFYGVDSTEEAFAHLTHWSQVWFVRLTVSKTTCDQDLGTLNALTHRLVKVYLIITSNDLSTNFSFGSHRLRQRWPHTLSYLSQLYGRNERNGTKGYERFKRGSLRPGRSKGKTGLKTIFCSRQEKTCRDQRCKRALAGGTYPGWNMSQFYYKRYF